MKKNIIIIIVVVSVIALLGAGIAVVMNLPGDVSGENNQQSDILLYDKTAVDAEQIIISNENGDFSFMGFSYAVQASLASEEKEKEEADQSSDGEVSESSSNLRTEKGFTPNDIKMHYTLQSLPDIELDKDMMNVLAYQCCYLTALQVVDKTGERYGEFGLESPRSTVTVVFSDGSSEKIMLGNNAPNDQGIYMRREKSPNVYLAVDGTVNMMLKAAYDFIDTTVTKELYSDPDSAEGTTVTSILVKGRAYKKSIMADDQGVFRYNTKYVMTSPETEIVESAYINSFAESFYDMEAESVVAAEPTAEDMKKFGMDDPYMDVTVSESDGSEIHMLASETDDKGYLYIMLSGGNVIYRMTKEGVSKWYDIDYTELLSPFMILPNPTAMTGLEITQGGKSYSFDVKTTVDETDLQQPQITTDVTYDGKAVDNARFNDYLNVLQDIIRIEMCDLSAEGLEPEYKAVMNFEKDGTKATDVFEIYKSSDGRHFAVLNGKTESYVSSEYFEAFLRQADRLTEGKEIESIEDIYSASSAEQSEES